MPDPTMAVGYKYTVNSDDNTFDLSLGTLGDNSLIWSADYYRTDSDGWAVVGGTPISVSIGVYSNPVGSSCSVDNGKTSINTILFSYTAWESDLSINFDRLFDLWGARKYFETAERYDVADNVYSGDYLCFHLKFTLKYNSFMTQTKSLSPIVVLKIYGETLETGALNEGVAIGESLDDVPFNYNIFILTLIAIPLIRRKMK